MNKAGHKFRRFERKFRRFEHLGKLRGSAKTAETFLLAGYVERRQTSVIDSSVRSDGRPDVRLIHHYQDGMLLVHAIG